MALRLTCWIITSVACIVLAVITVSETLLACSHVPGPAGTPTDACIEVLFARRWTVTLLFTMNTGTAERTLWLVPWVAMACLTALYLGLAWLLSRAFRRKMSQNMPQKVS